MYLKRLEINGFKSFAHKTSLEFEPGIISVVGPNGSGKSNFSDAIRWVLGEQSMKAIRSKKSEDVIFAGSDKKSKLGMAEVAITFDNHDRRLPIDYSEVTIARRLYRDGESEYLLNSQQVRLMDIVDLLAKSGYGNYTYHVIGQGTIDQLIISGPAAIKNLIEEASGVKPYYIKRERAMRKLEHTQSNLQRVADLIAEIEPRLRSLRRQAKRMEQRDEIVAELRQAQVAYFSGRYHELARDVAACDEKISRQETEIKQRHDQAELLAVTIKQLEERSVKGSAEYLRLQQDLRRAEQEKNRVQESLAIVRGQLKSGAAPGGVDQHSLEIRLRELRDRIAEIKDQQEGLKRQISLHEKNLADHAKIRDRLAADIEKARQGIDAAQQPFDLSKLKGDIEKVYSRYQSLLYLIKNIKSEDELQVLHQDAENLEILLVKLKDRFAHASNVQLDQAQLGQLHGKLQQIFEQKEKVAEELAAIQGSIDASRLQVQFFENMSQELLAELNRLEKQQGKTSTSGDESLQRLFEEEAQLAKVLQAHVGTVERLEEDLKRYLQSEQSGKQELLQLERQLRRMQDDLGKAKDQRNSEMIEKARAEANLESLLGEIRAAAADLLEEIKQRPPAAAEPGLEQKIFKLRSQLESIGGIDELTMQEYRETEERYGYLTTQSEDLQSAIGDLKQVIGELDAVIKKQFNNGFESINEKFSEYFRILFAGGRAGMTLVRERADMTEEGEDADESGDADDAEKTDDEANPSPQFGEEIVGIDIRATPPGKKLALLSALSGGERTMTAIALLMAILTAFPSPFVVLDEVDAALDEANSIRFGKILTRLAHQTQFITITHNRETMRNASILYGITMGDEGISKVLSIKLEKAVEIAQ